MKHCVLFRNWFNSTESGPVTRRHNKALQPAAQKSAPRLNAKPLCDSLPLTTLVVLNHEQTLERRRNLPAFSIGLGELEVSGILRIPSSRADRLRLAA